MSPDVAEIPARVAADRPPRRRFSWPQFDRFHPGTRSVQPMETSAA